MATYYITETHREPVAAPMPHQHIAAVRLRGMGNNSYARAEVMRAMRQDNDRFYTNAVPAAPVIIHHCPICGSADYITTVADGRVTNNLLALPQY